MQTQNKIKISAIVPVFNEKDSVVQVIEDLKKALISVSNEWEIIAVDDSSTDGSAEKLKTIPGIKTIFNINNKGYGASLKIGINEAKYDHLMFFDADGQHKTEYISEMIKYANDYDLVSGMRIGYKGPITRQPGKKALILLANYLTGIKIPDINCGLRIVKKDKMLKFLPILCNEFSFSTTTLLVFATEKYSIKWIPITINKRQGGKSGIRAKHALDTLMLILRTVLLTSPLKIFLPMVMFLSFLTLVSIIQNIITKNVSDGTVLLLISTILIFFFGLLADQVSSIRKEINIK